MQVCKRNSPRGDALIEIAAGGKYYQYIVAMQQVDGFATLGLIKH
jgi:hypothetical protein